MREVEDSMMSVQQKNSAYFVGAFLTYFSILDWHTYLRISHSRVFQQNGSPTMFRPLIARSLLEGE